MNKHRHIFVSQCDTKKNEIQSWTRQDLDERVTNSVSLGFASLVSLALLAFNSLAMQTYNICDLPLVLREKSKLVKKTKGKTINLPSNGMNLVLMYLKDEKLPETYNQDSVFDFCETFAMLKLEIVGKEEYTFSSGESIDDEKGHVCLWNAFVPFDIPLEEKVPSDKIHKLFAVVKKDIHLLHNFQQLVGELIHHEDFFPKYAKMIPDNLFDYQVSEMVGPHCVDYFPRNIQYLVKKGRYNKQDFLKFYLEILKNIDHEDEDCSTIEIFYNIVFDLIDKHNFEEEYLTKAFEKYRKFDLDTAQEINVYFQLERAIENLFYCINKPLKQDTLKKLVSSSFSHIFISVYPFDIDFETILKEHPCVIVNLLEINPKVVDLSKYLTQDILEYIVERVQNRMVHIELFNKALSLSSIPENQKKVLRQKLVHRE